MLQPSMGGRATVKKAPAGKSAKMLDSTEALNLRAKAAFDHSQRQEQRKPAAKRCVCKPGYCSVCVCVCACVRACVCVCVSLQTCPGLAGWRIVVPHCKIAVPNCNIVILHCNIAAS